ncbi:MAG TPA: phytanoyl-CoA dioxygenase family protein [Abditibacterium sp.]|jgi:hypothetical protein
MSFLTASQWEQYDRDGFLKLGTVLGADDLQALQNRIDDIMLGRAALDYSKILMQLDSRDGQYQNAGEQSHGHKGATLGYRKIQDLEHDDLFMAFMQKPIFREICAHIYGENTPIAAFRAMFMNKPASAGTLLPWHQDRWSALDRDPLLTTWTALDPATIENGCVEVIRGSHKWGLVNPDHGSGFVSPEQAEKIMAENQTEFLEMAPGETVLLHNWLLHRSDKNHSAQSRRAFSVCYMEAATVSSGGEQFTTIFGEESALLVA